MSPLFLDAFAFVVEAEGGIADDPRDPGGLTKYGITSRDYPGLDVRNLTVDDARAIYHRDFWAPLNCDALPATAAVVLFDSAVNCGGGRAARWLQRAVGVSDDGSVGPVTIAAAGRFAERWGVGALVREMLVGRLFHHTRLSTWDHFGLGWTRRLFDLGWKAAEIAARPQEKA